MANIIQNTVAGGLDLLATPLDIANMIAGLGYGAVNKLKGESFWEGFADNPFANAANKYHQGVTNLTGADEDSFTRRLVGNADVLLGVGAVSKGVGKALVEQGSKAAAKQLATNVTGGALKDSIKESIKPKNLANNIGNYAIADAAFNLLTPGESNTTDRIMQGVAATTLGVKGLKGLKNYKTIADVTDMTPEELAQYQSRELANKYSRLQRRKKWFDARHSVADMMQDAMGLSDESKRSLSREAKDKMSNWVETKELAEYAETFKNMSTEQLSKEQTFYKLNEELGARKGMLLDGLKQSKLLTQDEFNRLNTMDLLESMEFLKAKHPEQFNFFEKNKLWMPTQKILDEMAVLQHKLKRKYFVTPKMIELNEKVLNRAAESGLITKEDAAFYQSKFVNGDYLPSSSLHHLNEAEKRAVFKTSNPFEQKRVGMIYDDNGMPINYTGASDPNKNIELWFTKLFNELEACATNELKAKAIPVLEKRSAPAMEAMQHRINKLDNANDHNTANILREYRKTLQILPDTKENRAKNPQLQSVDLWDKGIKKTYLVSNDMRYVLENRAPNASIINQIISKVNRVFTTFISGKYNPFFLVKRIMYGNGELYPSVLKTLREAGYDVSGFDILAEQLKQTELSFKSNVAKTIVDAVDNNKWYGKFFDKNKYINDIIELDTKNLTRNDIMGDTLRNSAFTDNISIFATNPSKIISVFKRVWNTIDDSLPARLLDIAKNTVDDMQVRTVLSMIERYEPDLSKQHGLIDKVASFMSDTRRRGTGEDVLGSVFNMIQDYMPYGATSLQGLVGKLEYLPKDAVFKTKEFVKRDFKLNNHDVGRTTMDVMYKAGSVLANLPDNITFDILWKYIALPTTLCYLWNNMNDKQSSYYHSMQDYEKANKFVFTNFLGDGVNIAIPMDQEWSVLKNVFEIMLDATFGLSNMDKGNPAFSYKSQLAWSIGQDLGISLPVPAEMVMNFAGYKTNLDPTVPFTDEDAIQAINKYRYKRLNPEFATAVQTLTGKLGKILVNMAEDRPVMDYRYALPFLQLDPKVKPSNETISYLSQQLKTNPTPELKSWAYQRRKIKEDREFYARNGCTKKGEVYKNKDKVLAMYDRQLAELDDTTYRSIV